MLHKLTNVFRASVWRALRVLTIELVTCLYCSSPSAVIPNHGAKLLASILVMRSLRYPCVFCTSGSISFLPASRRSLHLLIYSEHFVTALSWPMMPVLRTFISLRRLRLRATGQEALKHHPSSQEVPAQRKDHMQPTGLPCSTQRPLLRLNYWATLGI